jgi:probable rRNA maturation factor
MAREVRQVVARILSDLGLAASEVTVSLVGDRTMRILNRDYLGKDRSTNVISFAMGEGEFGHLHPNLLGDVVVSADTAAREADCAGQSFRERCFFLIMHGLLHLAGYDHERSGEAEARRMWKKERELFALLQEEGLV